MRKVLTGILFMAMVSHPGIRAQDFGLQAGFGLQASRMDDMIYLQKTLLENYPVAAKTISAFPVYTTGSIRIVRKLYTDLKIGAGYSFATTGGRTNYRDYSGNMNTDMLATSHRIGAYAAYIILGGEQYELSVYGQVDASFTRLDITTTLHVMGYQDGLIYEYKSLTPSGCVGLEFFFHLNDFSVGLNAGYRIDKPGELTDLNTGDALEDPYDRDRILTTDWTGWHAQLMFMIWF